MDVDKWKVAKRTGASGWKDVKRRKTKKESET